MGGDFFPPLSLFFLDFFFFQKGWKMGVEGLMALAFSLSND